MAARVPFAVGEWYHCYSRGVDKRRVFDRHAHYNRFLMLMFAANGMETIHVSDLKTRTLASLCTDDSIKRGEPLVELGAYCLMPNHVHFLVKEIRSGGIAKYMQKIFTGYTMYFNKIHDRTGALFSGTFKSRHVGNDSYFKQAFAYIHLNPAALAAPRWKEGIGNFDLIEKTMTNYPYCSLPAFINENDISAKILGEEVFEMFDTIPSTRLMLKDARAYCTANTVKV